MYKHVVYQLNRKKQKDKIRKQHLEIIQKENAKKLNENFGKNKVILLKKC